MLGITGKYLYDVRLPQKVIFVHYLTLMSYIANIRVGEGVHVTHFILLHIVDRPSV